MKKQSLQQMKKEMQFKFWCFLDINVMLNGKNEISTDVYYKDTNTRDYLPYDSTHPKSCNKNVLYNSAKKIIGFVTDPEKVKLSLNEFRK